MDGKGSRFSFRNVEEFTNNIFWWCGSINEEKIGVRNPVAGEFAFLVLRFIESDDPGDVEMLEHLDVVLGGVAPPLLLVDVVKWPHEGNELAGDNPVEVAIFHLFVVFVLFVVELLELVPSKLDSPLKALEAMFNGARVAAVRGIGGISEWHELLMVWLKEFPYRRCLYLKDDDHEGAHQKCCIRLLLKLVTAVVKKAVIFVLRICQKSYQLSHVLVHQGKIQRPEIVIERIVNQFLVDGKEVGISVARGRSWPTDEEESVLNDLDVGAILETNGSLRTPVLARRLVRA
jgi:hypothetical protein